MALSRTIPALPVRDLAGSTAFYRDRLGFDVQHADDGISVLRRDEAVVHLWAASDERWRTRPDFAEDPVVSGAESFLAGTASCRIEVDAIEALYVEMSSAGVLHPIDTGVPQVTDFGTTEFHVLDDEGNLITFHQWQDS